MKRSTLLCLCCAVLPWGSLRAEAPAQVLLRGIEFPPGEAEKILRMVKMDERYEAMAKAVDEGKAVDVETAMMLCPVNRERFTAISAREVIHPVEYGSHDSGPYTPLPPEEIVPKKAFPPDNILGNAGTITALETQLIGNFLEAELGKARDPGLWWLTIHFETSVQEADRVALRFELFKGSPQQMAMAQFRVNRQVQDLLVVDGAWTMLGMFDSSRKDAPKGTKVVMWVNVEGPAPKKP